ncbi:MAG: hypothetical protein EBS23_07150, partial [Betaproteobacteria bacterium]|nr:hypothetical protein [Betaproteobacteria bacterium]
YGGNVTVNIPATTVNNATTPSTIDITAGNTLTLHARGSLSINNAINVSGANSGVSLAYNMVGGNATGDYSFGLSASGFSGRISYDNSSGVTGQTLSIQNGANSGVARNYTLLRSLNDLAAASAGTSGAPVYYALASNVIETTARGANLMTGRFFGTFAGLGNTITGLQMLGGSGASQTGIFKTTGNGAVIRDVGLVNTAVTGHYLTGSLVGQAESNLNLANIYATGLSVKATGNAFTGGLVGYTDGGTLTNAYLSGTVRSNSSWVGGVFGRSAFSSISNVTFAGVVASVADTETVISASSGGVNDIVGGVVGGFASGAISNSALVSGLVIGRNNVGGIVGGEGHYVQTLTNLAASGTVKGQTIVGGIMGYGRDPRFTSANSSTASGDYAGGVVGYTDSGTLASSVASGAVSAANYAGGLGGRYVGTVTSSTASGAVNTSGVQAGGLFGQAHGSITGSSASGAVTATGGYAGGLVGQNHASINTSGASGAVSAGSNGFAGGLVGQQMGNSISNSFATGSVTAAFNYGGIAGWLDPNASFSNTYYNIDVVRINSGSVVSAGGLYARQYDAWVGSNATVSSRSTGSIGDYFNQDANGYYLISSANSICLTGQTCAKGDISGLLGFSQNTNHKFKLANDLDMSAATTPYIPYLAASEFNGGGFEVENFAFSRPTSNLGFIGFARSGSSGMLPVDGLVVNLAPVNGGNSPSVSGRDYTGGAIGSLYNAYIKNSTVVSPTASGSPYTTVAGGNYTGGLAGYAYANTFNITTNGGVSGASYVGGVFGNLQSNLGSTTNCGATASSAACSISASGSVTASGSYAGGVFGRLEGGGVLSLISFTGDSVAASGERIGGLAGEFNGTLNDSSATGAVSAGSHYVGGLVGLHYSGSINRSSASGNVSSTNGHQVGGLVGQYNVGGGTIADSFATGAVSAPGNGHYVGGLVGVLHQGTITRSFATGNVSGRYHYIGGLVGYADGNSGTISSVYATGNVSSAEGEQVGGLIGHSERAVSSALATGNVTAASHYVGGLIGVSYRSVTATRSTGTVTATNTDRRYIGGLIGYQDGSSYTVSDSSHTGGAVSGGNSYVGGLIGKVNGSAVVGSYANTSVTGAADFVGGLIGWTNGEVRDRTSATNAQTFTYNASLGNTSAAFTMSASDFGATFSYASGAVSGRNDVGGLIGRADASTAITNAYYGGTGGAGTVSAERNYGGLIGFLTPGATVTNSHYNIDAVELHGFTTASPSARTTVAGAISDDVITVGGLFNDTFTGRTQGQFDTWFNSGALDGLSGSAPATAYFGAADAGAYQLASVQNLRDYLGFADRTDLAFKLAPTTGNSIALSANLYIPYLAGSFDPNNKSITGLALDQYTSNLGFIGQVRAQSVGNLTITNGSVTGLNNVGLLAGAVWRGSVNGANASGATAGRNITYSADCCEYGDADTGGLVGYATAVNRTDMVVSNSTANVTVVASGSGFSGEQVGGLVGRIVTGSVTGSTATGTVTGTHNVGGLVGRIITGDVTASSSTNAVTGTGDRVGGLIGWMEGSNTSAIGVFHTTGTVTGSTYVGGLIGQSEGTVGATGAGNTAYATSAVLGSGSRIGGLIGYVANGSVTNAYATGQVGLTTQRRNETGGLVGWSDRTISNSYATGTVYGAANTGGLVGYSTGAISGSNRSGGLVSGTGSWVGGLVGQNRNTVSDSYSSSGVSGNDGTGGLAGFSSSSITNSYATGTISATSHRAGGLVGYFESGSITDSYATGSVTSSNASVGGLVGENRHGGTVSRSYASGAVSGTSYVGGLVGLNYGNLAQSSATGAVTGTGSHTGGLVGWHESNTISDSWASGRVVGTNEVGGFVGRNQSGTITRSATSASVSGSNSSNSVGGFAGRLESGSILLSSATGAVSGRDYVGGFLGWGVNGSVDRAYATGAVTATGSAAGGFVGALFDSLNTGSIRNSYAMGAVTGTTEVGGFVGTAQRGSLGNLYSTGFVRSTTGATSVGGFFGAGDFNQTNGVTRSDAVTASNLYFDASTSGFAGNQTLSAINAVNSVNNTITPTVATALSTTALQGTLPTGFESATTLSPGGGTQTVSNQVGHWATGSGLYPYLRELFGGPLTLTTANNVTTGAYNQTPQAISGTASLASNAAAVGAQVGVYAGGKLLGGGTLSTGANGYYYTLVGASMSTPLASSQLSIGASTGIGANLRLAGANDDAGGRYTDLPVLTGSNLTGFDLSEGLNAARTSATSLTALGARVDAVFGNTSGNGTLSSGQPTLAEDHASVDISASGAFDVDASINLTRATGAPSNAGNLSIAASNITLSRDVSTAGGQVYGSNVTLAGTAGSSRFLTTGGVLDIKGTLNGSGIGLSVTNAAGDAIFRNSVAAANLSVSGNTTLYGAVSTTGAQSYGGNLSVGSDVNLSSAGGGVSILGGISGLATQPTLLYQTTTPRRSGDSIVYTAGYGLASSDAAALFTGSFSRITYRMEVSVGGTLRYAEASFDPWQSGLTAQDLRIPDLASANQFTLQKIVSNLSVDSNMTASTLPSKSTGVITGSGKTGYIELWPWNYGTELTGPSGVGGNSNTYDINDAPEGSSGYGSFQLHNLTDNQTVMAWNNHSSSSPDIGLGSQVGGTGNPDWTFAGSNSLGESNWRLQISVNGGTPALKINAGTGAVNIQGATSGLRSLDVSSDAAASAIAGVVSGATSLTKSGSGTLSLTAANTYTGMTRLTAGALVVSGSLSDATTVDVSAGAIYRVDASDFINALIGAGTVTTSASSGNINLGVGGDDSDRTFSGSIQDGSAASLSLAKSGNGTLTLTGTNTYSGVTSVNGGVLRIGDGGTSGSVTGDIFNGTSLIFDRTDSLRYAGDVYGPGSLTKNGAGTLTITGFNTYDGSTTINGGTLAIGGSGFGATGDIAIGSGATFAHASSSGQVTTGVVSGAGSVLKSGSGLLALANPFSSYSGGTRVESGLLVVGTPPGFTSSSGSTTSSSSSTFTSPSNSFTVSPSTSFLGSGAVIVAPSSGGSGAAIDVNGNSLSNALTLSGNGSTHAGSASGALFNSASTPLTLSGSVTLTGNTLITSLGSLFFTGNINSQSSSTNASLSAVSDGDLTVNGQIGNVVAPTSLSLRGSQVLTLGSNASVRANGNINLVAGARFVNNAVASTVLQSTTGSWRVWSSNSSPFASSGGDVFGGLVYDFKQYGASFGSSAVLGSGNGWLFSLAAPISLTASGIAPKVYDGNTTASLNGVSIVASGAIGSDAISIVAGSGAYDSPDAGARTVTLSGLSIAADNNGRPVFGYLAPSSVSLASNILPGNLPHHHPDTHRLHLQNLRRLHCCDSRAQQLHPLRLHHRPGRLHLTNSRLLRLPRRRLQHHRLHRHQRLTPPIQTPTSATTPSSPEHSPHPSEPSRQHPSP